MARRKLTAEERARLPPEGKLGDCMKVLSERHQLFVVALLDQGSEVNLTAAAESAGYKGRESGGLRVTAHHLARDPKILAALQEEARKRMKLGTVVASALLNEFIMDKEVDARVRLKAAGMVLDRGGLPAQVGVNVQHTHTLGRDEKLLRVMELAKAQGLDPKQLLGSLIDVTQEEVLTIENRIEHQPDA